MNRILLILLLFSACLSSCIKSNDAAAKIKAQEAIDGGIIATYLKNNNLTAKVVDSAGVSTGVYYIVNTPGTGSDLFTNSTQVTIGYTGWLLNSDSELGPVIAQTVKFHPSYVLGSVIRGWQLGLGILGTPTIQNGGTVTLFVPSHYAYGPFPQTDLGLPANAVLIFKITLYNVTN